VSNFLAFTVIGLCTAGAYAIAASGLVLTYTTTGIFNFAHGAIGMLMAFTYWELAVHHHWPQPLALAVVLLVIAPVVGLVIERVLMRKLATAEAGVTLAVTLGLLVLLIGVANAIWPSRSRFVPQFFNGHSVKVFGVSVTYHKIVMFGLAALVALMLRLLLYRTRIGVAMRGVVDDRELAAMNGMKPVRVSQLSWALSASLAGLAGILLAPDLSLDVIRLTFVVVIAYSAAIVGRLKSLPLTFLGAIILGLADAYAQTYINAAKHPFLANVRPTMPAFLLFGMLLIIPAARLKPGRRAGRRSPRVPGGREAALGAAALVAVSIIASEMVNGAINLQALNTGMATALVVLSLVILTGYGGQFSLAQMSLAGIGVVVFHHLGRGGSPLALVACAAVCAVVGAVVALFAVRLQGLYLALATLAFALLADQLFFANSGVFGGSGSSTTIHHLAIGGLAVKNNHTNLVLLAVVFGLFGMGTLAIRRGGFGRTLAAMSDSDAACATLGLNLTLTKVSVFALSAAMAGVAGALYGGTQVIVGGMDFYYVQSLIVFLMAYIGGVNTVTGALIGGMALGAVFPIVSPHLPHSLQQLAYLGTGLGAVTIAGQGPSGIMGQLSGAWARLRLRPPARVSEGGPIAAPVG
jgi:branched-chain amino acid transport system permease protein